MSLGFRCFLSMVLWDDLKHVLTGDFTTRNIIQPVQEWSFLEKSSWQLCKYLQINREYRWYSPQYTAYVHADTSIWGSRDAFHQTSRPGYQLLGVQLWAHTSKLESVQQAMNCFAAQLLFLRYMGNTQNKDIQVVHVYQLPIIKPCQGLTWRRSS